MAQATIQRIEKTSAIEGADKIERAAVLGWGVVVRKGEYKPGDLCVFVEIDSVLPDGPAWAEFMRPRSFRVRTARLRGCLSQGLVLPLNILPSGYADPTVCTIGADVSGVLGITHYEETGAGGGAGGQSAGPFPPVPQTGEVRLQSFPALLSELRTKSFCVTAKVDGVSGTFARMHAAYGPYAQGELVVATRRCAIKRSPGEGDLCWGMADKHRLAEVLPEGFAIQGEIAGPGLKKNRLCLPALELFVFRVFDMRHGCSLDFYDMVNFCITAGLRTVPIVGTFEPKMDGGWVQSHGERRWVPPAQEAFLHLAEGHYEGTKNRREGIVVCVLDGTRSEVLGGKKLSFKVVSNTYLLKDEGP